MMADSPVFPCLPSPPVPSLSPGHTGGMWGHRRGAHIHGVTVGEEVPV